MVGSGAMPRATALLRAADRWAASSGAAKVHIVHPGSPPPPPQTPPPQAHPRAALARCTFVSTATTPTVTMPRLKALMTGVNPSFVDIFRNFDATVAAPRDNMLRRLRLERDYRLVLLGDDTWAKLFPDVFDRALSDPTHSFFAQDTTEVDDNVTRHLSEFLDPTLHHAKSRAWDGIVMHYLGLDHVGHIRGPRSSLMRSKQAEMDAAIDRIVRAIAAQDSANAVLEEEEEEQVEQVEQVEQEEQEEEEEEEEANNDDNDGDEDEDSNGSNDSSSRRVAAKRIIGHTLFVLLSDHGMTESGNHGGASKDETNSVLAVFPPRAVLSHMERHQRKEVSDDDVTSNTPISAFAAAPTVDQLDLVPTLAALLGTSIPIENQGVALQPALRALLSPQGFMQALVDNMEQSWKWATRGHGATLLSSEILRNLSDAHSAVAHATRMQPQNKRQLYVALNAYLQAFEEHCGGQTNDGSGGDHGRVRLQVVLGICLMFAGAVGLVCYVVHLAQIHSSANRVRGDVEGNTGGSYRRWVILRCNARFADEWFLGVVVVVLNVLALTSSSMIENEHAVWHHVAATWCLLRAFRGVRAATLANPATSLPHILSTLAARLSLPWWCAFFLMRMLREGTQVINFARLNRIEEPNFVGATAVISTPLASMDVANGGPAYTVFGALCAASAVSVWFHFSLFAAESAEVGDGMYRKGKSKWQNILTMVLIAVGFASVSVHIYFVLSAASTSSSSSASSSSSSSFSLDGMIDNVHISDAGAITACVVCALMLAATSVGSNIYHGGKRRRSAIYGLAVAFFQFALLVHRPERVTVLGTLWMLGLVLHSLLRRRHRSKQARLAVDSTSDVVSSCVFDALAFLVVGQIGFYAMGNSHTIGTVDFAGAYTGATRFGKVSTGSIAGLMVFTGPILLALLGASALSLSIDADANGLHTLLPLLICVAYRAVVLAGYSLVALGFRHHLFVWSVFAPKLIYEIGQFAVQVLVLCSVTSLLFMCQQRGKMKAV
jgi:hypothetical protein